jgi:hypothetical protein
MATHMERIGVEPHIIEVCLGHALKGGAGMYRQYGYMPEKAKALQAWADELLLARGYDLGTAPGGEDGSPRGAMRAGGRSSQRHMARGDAPGVDDSPAAVE